MMPAGPSQVCQNYHPDCQAAINSHVTLELHASYVCLAMAFNFDRDDVALKHFARFFLRRSRQLGERAESLMHLQNQRGGRLCFHDIRKPDRDAWESGLQAMQCTLRLEKGINQSLLHLYQLASDKSDAHLCHYLQRHCLNQQVPKGDLVKKVKKKTGGSFGKPTWFRDSPRMQDSCWHSSAQ
nr:ferritin heavy chain [Vicugna pacos]